MGFGRISSGKEKGQNLLFVRDFGLFCPLLDLLAGGGGDHRNVQLPIDNYRDKISKIKSYSNSYSSKNIFCSVACFATEFDCR